MNVFGPLPQAGGPGSGYHQDGRLPGLSSSPLFCCLELLQHQQVEIEHEADQLTGRDTGWCWCVCLREGLSPTVSPIRGRGIYAGTGTHSHQLSHQRMLPYYPLAWKECSLAWLSTNPGLLGVTRACVVVTGEQTGWPAISNGKDDKVL